MPDWIGRKQIPAIEGALKPAAYVQRAYLHSREHGDLPPWARKDDRGRWLFRRDYIVGDGRLNRETMTVGEIAKVLGATRRTVQNWVDEGVLPSVSGDHDPGAVRRVRRDVFEDMQSELLQRLASPAVLGRKRRTGERRRKTGEPFDPLKEARRLTAEFLEARFRLGRLRAGRGAGDFSAQAAAQRLEDQLQLARRQQETRKAWVAAAERIAQRILNDVFDDRITRTAGVILYMRLARQQDIPEEVVAQVRRQCFGRGG